MARAGCTVIFIRPMEEVDVELVGALEREVFPQPWSDGAFRHELRQENRCYLVAEEDGSVIGYGGLMLVADEGHVTTLAVDPKHRRSGLGTRLLLKLAERALEMGARHLTLEVRSGNTPALGLYRKFGFAPVGIRKRYYRDADALVMWAVDADRDEYRSRLRRIEETLR